MAARTGLKFRHRALPERPFSTCRFALGANAKR